ncbi:bacterio-opsin activator domain-containing protein [Natronomonas sp. EA1]|uniref:bacterio-opsin activator domain-containing protein n=1 Tax=Natronomonas sp. EA1 TaxID=3421655 RepID=UPI003EB71098
MNRMTVCVIGDGPPSAALRTRLGAIDPAIDAEIIEGTDGSRADCALVVATETETARAQLTGLGTTPVVLVDDSGTGELAILAVDYGVDGYLTPEAGMDVLAVQCHRAARGTASAGRRFLHALPRPSVVHRENRLVDANAAAVELLGLTGRDDAYGRQLSDWLEPIHPARRHGVPSPPFGSGAGGTIEDAPPTERYLGRLHRPDGERRRVEVTTTHGRGLDGLSVSILEDVTERHRYEIGLGRIHTYIRQLIGGGTEREVASRITIAVAEVLDYAAVATYGFDRDAGTFTLRAWSEAVDPDTIDTDALEFDAEGPLQDAFVAGTVVPFHGAYHPEPEVTFPVHQGLVLPLGNAGLVVAGSPEPDPLTNGRRQLSYTLVDILEAVLERLHQEAERRERDERRAERTRQLERLAHLDETVRGVVRAAVRADTREALERTVVDRFTGDELYQFAWIVGHDDLTDRLHARTHPAIESAVFDRVATPDDPIAALARRAIRTESVTVTADVLDDNRWRRHRRDALGHDYRSVIAVPLGTHHGVMGVLLLHLRHPDELVAQERAVLASVGEVIGYLLHDRNRTAPQLGSGGVSLELRSDGDLLFSRLAAWLDTPVSLRGVVPGTPHRLFLTAETSADHLVEAATGIEQVHAATPVVDEGDRCLVRVDVERLHLVEATGAFGGALTALTADSLETAVIVTLDADDAVRPFVERLQERYPGMRLHARRAKSAPETAETVRARLESACTDRQLEALRLAYYSGYYEWPHACTTAALADTLGIAATTYQYHLRTAERRLLETVFDPTTDRQAG